MSSVPVLEVGGTHVSAALIDPAGWTVGRTLRRPLDANASAAHVISGLISAGTALQAAPGSQWGVAMPDPFDYARGIAMFEGVGKFRALRGVDLGAALRSGLRGAVDFVNDADAFLLGEWTIGAAIGAKRCAGLTLGTGIGTAWLVNGRIVDPGMPPGGRLHRMDIAGQPLEDVVSRRAIRRAYTAAGGSPALDVREIAAAARAGEGRARQVIDRAMAALGRVMGRCLAGFRADVLVIGGSMAGSWDLFEPAFRAGALGNALPAIVLARANDRAGLVGAAVYTRTG